MRTVTAQGAPVFGIIAREYHRRNICCKSRPALRSEIPVIANCNSSDIKLFETIAVSAPGMRRE